MFQMPRTKETTEKIERLIKLVSQNIETSNQLIEQLDTTVGQFLNEQRNGLIKTTQCISDRLYDVERRLRFYEGWWNYHGVPSLDSKNEETGTAEGNHPQSLHPEDM